MYNWQDFIYRLAHDLSDVVVVAGYDGILVSSKDGSSRLKPLAEKISAQPMYQQCEWGTYSVIEQKQAGDKETIVKRLKLEAGKLFEHKSESCSETWVIISGKGILTDIKKEVGKADLFSETVISGGSVAQLEKGKSYSILAATELELFDIEIKEAAE